VRADARDNRGKILAAANEVFGAGGETASTEDVAARAGVGIATVFRHFPTKQDLLHAVLTARLEALRDRARELAAEADPGAAFRTFFTETVTTAPTKLAIAEALMDTGPLPEPPTRVADEVKEAFAALLERAQAAGAIRADVGWPEVWALMIGASRAETIGPDPAVRDRAIALIFDGLRPPG
jgi:AcrR family transcriptional regulator